jgi:Rrf2 family protein
MRISRQADYAIRVVLDLSLHPEARIREVARRQRLSVSYVGRISQRLAKTGILDNKRGRLGCLSLASSPDQISILDVIEAIDAGAGRPLPAGADGGARSSAVPMGQGFHQCGSSARPTSPV